MLKPQPKIKPVRNPKYLAWIRTLPCIITVDEAGHVCGRLSEPSHINPKGHGAKGSKCSDLRSIPNCSWHHQEYHQIGRDSFAEKYNLDYEMIIERLNKIWEGMNASR